MFKPDSHPFVSGMLGNLEGKEREGCLNLIRDMHMLETELPKSGDGIVFRTQMNRDFDLTEVSF